MLSVHFQGKPFTITIIQIYAPTTEAEEAEIDQFYDDLEKLLELTPINDVLFIIGNWKAKIGSQEIPGVTGKLGLGEQNETGQRLTEFFHKNALVIENILFIIGNWNANVGCQDIPGVTGKFSLGEQNETGQR